MRRGWLLLFGGLLAGCGSIFDLEKIDYTPPPPCEPLGVDTGREHTCAVDYRGEVRCWGQNDEGEVLPGAPDLVLQPLQPVLPGPAAQVAVGRHHSCARLVDGAVWCWGTSRENQLALGAGVHDSDVPVAIVGLPPSAQISSGAYQICSRSADDGTVWCWGSNSRGEAGQATSLDCEPDNPDQGACSAPTAIPNTAGTKSIALGHRFSCLINAEDRVACWGANNGRQLAVDTFESTHVPTIIAQIGTATAIAASGRTVCAVETSGSVKCWGGGSEGQLGNGTFTSQPSPPVGTLVQNAREISLSNFGGCAVLRDGKVSCWGNSDHGTGAYMTSPTPQTALLTDARQISGDFFHQCAIASGELYCWGSNARAQLGRGAQSLATTSVTAIESGATHIAAGGIPRSGKTHMCAIANGELYCWGDNDHGQAGDPSLARIYVPTKVATSVLLEGVAAGANQTCVWGAGSAECWGEAWTGRLGTGTDQRSQERAATLATNVSHVTVGLDHMCALLASNEIQCFGWNGQGQVGLDPSQSDRSMNGNIVSTVGLNLGTIDQVVAGGHHTCARTSTGVWCWGKGDDGQLGYGGTADQYVPHLVTDMVAKDLASGDQFSCAVEVGTGDVYCWGRNTNGELGIGSRQSQSLAQKVIGLPAPAMRVFSGATTRSVCAVLTTGALYCWGDGEYGQLGNGILADQGTASLASSFATATAGAMGGSGMCAIVAGQVKCVGEWRMLGNGDQSLSVPTVVDLGIGACPVGQ